MMAFRQVIRLALALAVVAASPAALAQPLAPAPRMAASPQSAADGRVEDLVRIWYFARLFHPNLAGAEQGWDAALVAAVPKVLAAPDDAAFAGIVDDMLAAAGRSSASPPGPPQQSLPTSPPPFRLEAGTPIASCLGLGRLASEAAFKDAVAAAKGAIAARGLVLDCRNIPAAYADAFTPSAIRSWIAAAAGITADAGAAPGWQRVRLHDGYPPESGSTSGGYVQGTAVLALPPQRAESIAPLATAAHLVILVDETTPNVWEVAAGLRAKGAVRIVADGSPLYDVQQSLILHHVTARIAVVDYVGPDGSTQLLADACVAAGHAEEALLLAVAMLDPAAKGPACPAGHPMPVNSASAPADPAGAPSLGERVLALAKIWGAIEYFYPYRKLLDEPWDGQLREFVPGFLAADSRAAYEEAVQRLAHRIQDTHVSVGGQAESFLGLRRFAPPIYVRPVGGGFAVAGLHVSGPGDQIRIGDEILAVDGVPVRTLAAEIGARIAASTPQSLAGRTASWLLLGPEGSKARLTLRRAGGPDIEVTVKRTLNAHSASSRPADPRPAWRRLAPGIGYVDLERLRNQDADKALDALLDTKAIVFDLRGYPQGTAWVIAPRLALPGRDGAVAASFRRPHYIGSGDPGMDTAFEQPLPPTAKPHYKGKVIVLIDERAISQSEHTALFFKAAAKPIFVGTPTTGANGDVTTIVLPGGLTMPFTGHDVRFPDGTQLQRRGIQPDIRVAPTLADLRAGRDPVLEAGLRLARAK
jgi:C-terminal processing protease CtpA/Prc